MNPLETDRPFHITLKNPNPKLKGRKEPVPVVEYEHLKEEWDSFYELWEEGKLQGMVIEAVLTMGSNDIPVTLRNPNPKMRAGKKPKPIIEYEHLKEEWDFFYELWASGTTKDLIIKAIFTVTARWDGITQPKGPSSDIAKTLHTHGFFRNPKIQARFFTDGDEEATKIQFKDFFNIKHLFDLDPQAVKLWAKDEGFFNYLPRQFKESGE
jgi:hypothetical protein